MNISNKGMQKYVDLPNPETPYIFDKNWSERCACAALGCWQKLRWPPAPGGNFKFFVVVFFENFEGYSADTCAETFLLVSMEG
jgi:hypothetical protein